MQVSVHRPSDVSSGANQAPSHGFHESRDTKHESRPFFACFDRRVVRNAGWCPRAARTSVPTARSLLSCALWCGMARPWRGMGGILPPAPASLPRQPFSVGPRRAPIAGRFPSPSALLPPRRKRHEPMMRKGNVLVCVDTRSTTRSARRLAEVRGSGPVPARYSANRERANLLHSGGGKKVTRPVSNMGAVPMESAEDHRTRACVHKMFQEAEAKRVVRPDGSGIRFPRSTSS